MLNVRKLYVKNYRFYGNHSSFRRTADQTVARLQTVNQSWNQDDQIVFRSYKVNDALADLLTAFNNESYADTLSVKEFFLKLIFQRNIRNLYARI